MSFYFVFEYFSYINMYSDNENCLKVNIFYRNGKFTKNGEKIIVA